MTAHIGFLVIGAQKGGTTSLFEYIRRHPQVHVPRGKEVLFFHRSAALQRGRDWYLTTVMRDAPEDAVCGEVSTLYMNGTPFGDVLLNEEGRELPTLPGSDPLEEVVPRRIKQVLPDVKLICVLRDPVARAYSHHRMMRLERAETRPFDEAIAQLMVPSELDQARVAPTRTNSYIVNGEYGRVLKGYMGVFPPEQLIAIFSDELANRPAETLATLFEFIGVASDFVPDNLNIRYRTAAEKERIAGLNLFTWQMNLARVRPARALWHALPNHVRSSIDRTFTEMGYHIGMWNARRGVVGDDMSPATRRKLQAHFRPDSEALGDILDRGIPWLSSWDRK